MESKLHIESCCRITDKEVVLNDAVLYRNPGYEGLKEWLDAVYKSLKRPYPKYYKMDLLAKAGYLAAELLLQDDDFSDKEDMAVVLFNNASSLDNDCAYQKTISDSSYYPAPAVFVYTLPNIVAGEIAIRHRIFGETSFYVFETFSQEKIFDIVEQTLADSGMKTALFGWVDVLWKRCDVILWKANIN